MMALKDSHCQRKIPKTVPAERTCEETPFRTLNVGFIIFGIEQSLDQNKKGQKERS